MRDLAEEEHVQSIMKNNKLIVAKHLEFETQVMKNQETRDLVRSVQTRKSLNKTVHHIVIDCSGSMEGNRLESVKKACKLYFRTVAKTHKTDQVIVTMFNDTVRSFSAECVDSQNLDVILDTH